MLKVHSKCRQPNREEEEREREREGGVTMECSLLHSIWPADFVVVDRLQLAMWFVNAVAVNRRHHCWLIVRGGSSLFTADLRHCEFYCSTCFPSMQVGKAANWRRANKPNKLKPTRARTHTRMNLICFLGGNIWRRWAAQKAWSAR